MFELRVEYLCCCDEGDTLDDECGGDESGNSFIALRYVDCLAVFQNSKTEKGTSLWCFLHFMLRAGFSGEAISSVTQTVQLDKYVVFLRLLP